MITLFYGPKGSGKTKRIIDSANDSLNAVKGTVVYITDKKSHSKEVSNAIRFIDVNDYKIKGVDSIMGFIKGILASDNDLERIYIDGFARISTANIEEMEVQFKELEALVSSDKVEFYLTVSCEVLPSYLKKYI